MAIRLITAPTVQPLTLAEVKAHLRVDHSDEDDLIAAYIEAATSYADGEYGFLGRALVTQTWELVIDTFPTHEIKIPLPPLQSVESVKYDDGDGVEQTLSTSLYTVDSALEPGWIVPPVGTGWPSSVFDGINSVRVRYVAGYDPTTDSPVDLRANIPRAIRQALLLLIGAMYQQREEVVIGVSVMKMPWASEQLLRPFRVTVPFA